MSATPFTDTGGIGKAELKVPPILPHAIVNPDWLQRPGADAIAKAYPEAAQRMGVGGLVTLGCEVTAAGAVTNCGVISEAPQGYGFSRAALSLSRYFRMRPGSVDGQPV